MDRCKDYIIRPAAGTDVSGIAELLREAGWFGFINAERPEDTAVRVGRNMGLCLSGSSHDVLVAGAPGGRILGYASVHWLPYLMASGPDGYVSELFVSKSCRGRGIGRALLARVREMAGARGCSRLMLVTVRSREAYEKGFYAAAGFEERPEHAVFVYPMKA